MTIPLIMLVKEDFGRCYNLNDTAIGWLRLVDADV